MRIFFGTSTWHDTLFAWDKTGFEEVNIYKYEFGVAGFSGTDASFATVKFTCTRTTIVYEADEKLLYHLGIF